MYAYTNVNIYKFLMRSIINLQYIDYSLIRMWFNISEH